MDAKFPNCVCVLQGQEWSNGVKRRIAKKVNPTAGILNNLVLTRTSGCFLPPPPPPFCLSVAFTSGHLASTHTFLSRLFLLLRVAAARLTQPSALFLGPDELCVDAACLMATRHKTSLCFPCHFCWAAGPRLSSRNCCLNDRPIDEA